MRVPRCSRALLRSLPAPEVVPQRAWLPRATRVARSGGHVRTRPLPPMISEGEGGVHLARKLPDEVNRPHPPPRNRGRQG
eukprot:3741150-Pyramimonas_sp.AAC.1